MNLRIRSPAWLLAIAVNAAGAWPQAARAELWGYVDGAGVAHVGPAALDSRYQLVLGDAPREAPRKVLGKADRVGDLVTWLEYAPEPRVLQPVLREAARVTGVDVELLRAVIAVESGFDVHAVSPRGAVGLMQITPETADRYASRAELQRPATERLRDARINVLTGARMLADLTRRFGSIDIALAAWNAGEGTVMKHGGKMPPIDETRAHVQLVLELYWAMLQSRQSFLATQMTLDRPAP